MQLWVAFFFLLAVEHVSEVVVAISRITDFISLEEPDAPGLLTGREAAGNQADAEGGDPPVVSVDGADFSWENWSGKAQAGAPETNGMEHAEAPGTNGEASCTLVAPSLTLRDVRLSVRRGELIGICGEVWEVPSDVQLSCFAKRSGWEKRGEGNEEGGGKLEEGKGTGKSHWSGGSGEIGGEM